MSPEFRRHALFENDDKDIVIIGAVSRVEIWNKRVYDEYTADMETDFDAMFSQLEI